MEIYGSTETGGIAYRQSKNGPVWTPFEVCKMSVAENGCLNIINSGRTYCNLDRRLEGIPIDGWVLGCGTRVILDGETLLNFQWNPEESREIREQVLSIGLPVVYEGNEALWMEKSDPGEHPLMAGMRKYALDLGIGRIIDADHPDFSFTKIFTFDPKGVRVKTLMELLRGRFQAIERKDTGDASACSSAPAPPCET